MFSKYSNRFLKSVEDRPCLGCYSDLNRSRPKSSLAKINSPASDSDECDSRAACKRKGRSVHFETSSSYKETPPSFRPPHSYNLRSSPSEHYCCNGSSKSKIYAANDITPLDIDDACGDYVENDLNSNSIPKSRSVSALKKSIEERIAAQSSLMSCNKSRSTFYASKEGKFRYSFQYYHAKLAILWWQTTDYLINDLFNYYNRVILNGFLLVLLALLLAHLILHNVPVTEDRLKGFASGIDNLVYSFLQRSWSAMPARIGSKVLTAF